MRAEGERWRTEREGGEGGGGEYSYLSNTFVIPL